MLQWVNITTTNIIHHYRSVFRAGFSPQGDTVREQLGERGVTGNRLNADLMQTEAVLCLSVLGHRSALLSAASSYNDYLML
jgi:hypothetical protein